MQRKNVLIEEVKMYLADVRRVCTKPLQNDQNFPTLFPLFPVLFFPFFRLHNGETYFLTYGRRFTSSVSNDFENSRTSLVRTISLNNINLSKTIVTVVNVDVV